MNIQIGSLDEIQQLKEGDIVLHPTTNQSFSVDQICDDYLILSDENEHRALRMIFFSRLISEKWQLAKFNIQARQGVPGA